MVVIDNARKMIGKNADISVTSVLQTTAGKMIFGRLSEESYDNGASVHSTDTRGINGGTATTATAAATRRPYRSDPRPQTISARSIEPEEH
jgi:hypothetical protein